MCLIRSAVAQGRGDAVWRAAAKRRGGRYAWAAPQPVELASAFPQVEVLELLGQGGMGAVYRGRQRSLDRPVALKLISRELADDPAFLERFHDEARTLGRLKHPNIVAVYDYGQAGPYCYFVMEYVEGCNLREAIHAGRLTAAEALHIAVEVCEALDYAHQQGVVHRDIKPENILLENGLPIVPADDPAAASPLGKVKITDFGLARLLPERNESALTTDGRIVGTPLYMAPEQIERPREIDHRADVYSFGVVLYEMLTGGLPLGRFGPVSQQAGVDRRLDAAVYRCLEKDPQRRYQRVADLRADVAAVLAGPGPAGEEDLPTLELLDSPSRWSRVASVVGRLAPWILAAVLLLWIVVPSDRSSHQADSSGPAPERPAQVEAAVPPVEAARPAPPAPNPPTKPSEVATSQGKEDDQRYPVELSNARLFGRSPNRTIRVEYRFRRGFPAPMSRFYWVIESAGGAVETSEIRWPDMSREGTLRMSVFPQGLDEGPYEIYMEADDMMGMGMGMGRTRRRISNIVKLPETAP